MSDEEDGDFLSRKRFTSKKNRNKKRKCSAISIQFSDVTKAKCRALNKSDDMKPVVPEILDPVDEILGENPISDDWESFFSEDTHEDQGSCNNFSR